MSVNRRPPGSPSGVSAELPEAAKGSCTTSAGVPARSAADTSAEDCSIAMSGEMSGCASAAVLALDCPACRAAIAEFRL